jgi:hypothetical protein
MGGLPARENGDMESQDGDDFVGDAPLGEDRDGPHDGGGFDRWRKESAIGGIGTGIARGLQSVFGSPRQEIAIVAEVPGEPPDADTRLRVILDPDDPTK